MATKTIKYRTQFDAQEAEVHYYAPTGKRTEMRHSAHMDKDGRRFLKADKEVAIYDLIQSHKEECEIENIIRRAVEGDYNALNAINGTFADITNCPSSIAEAQQYIIDAKTEFEKLPKEIRAKFENNAEIYIAEMGNDPESWLDKMGYTKAVELEKIKEDRARGLAIANEAVGDIATGEQIKTGGEVNE